MKLIVTFCVVLVLMGVGFPLVGLHFPTWQIACGAVVPTAAIWFVWEY